MKAILSTLFAACVLTGCTSMLPRGSADTPSPFDTYADAQAAAERVLPFKTSVQQLASLGFDPANGRNVTLIPYPEIVARLVPYSGVPLEQLDEGVRACVLAKSACRGYAFLFQREDRRREGGFLADFLNVHRVTHVTGWRFEALFAVTDDTVLFRNFAGDAHVERLEKQTNPLGPLQPAGEAAGSLLVH